MLTVMVILEIENRLFLTVAYQVCLVVTYLDRLRENKLLPNRSYYCEVSRILTIFLGYHNLWSEP